MKNLEDLIPMSVDWNLSYEDGDGKSHELEFCFRKFNLEDDVWLKKTFPGEELQNVFATLDSEGLAKIAFRQLDFNSKKKLMSITFMDMDEDGNEIQIAEKGYEKVAMLISGEKGKVDVLKKLLETRGISSPILNEIQKGVEAGKFNALLRKMGLEEVGVEGEPRPIGEKSSTSSQANMAGR